ncbi:phosphoenolpyruvate-utilizing N-terminal domain-containing protein, partial [Pseudomonas viridiflava]|uniref:phosphoenolpyruvate-utilizing N-terminal domain-containing protein n=1 Tax=Pseudomonas viridiflava TaxID=33069 RepID=UPI0024075C6F
IFKAQAEILRDPTLMQAVATLLVDGHSAEWIWNKIIREQATKLEYVGQAVLAARATDLRDVGSKVLRKMIGEDRPLVRPKQKNTIIVAHELNP